MNTPFMDLLDIAIERMQQGEMVTAVLEDYPEQAEHLAPLLESADLLNTCVPVLSLSPEEGLADQQHFLDQLAQLPLPTVSSSPIGRLNNWMINLFTWLGLHPKYAKREQKMSTLLLKATFILTLLFGSIGGTAVLAAESLPDSPLYPAKMIMEETRLGLASDSKTEAEIHIGLASERLREMERLMVAGKMPDDALLTHAENHVQAVFDLAAEMPAQKMAGILLQTQAMVQTRTQAFTEIEARIPEHARAAFNQAQQMLQNAGEITGAGLQEPQLFRQRQATNRPDTAPEQPEILPPALLTSTQTITTPVRVGPAGPCAQNEDCEPMGNGPYGPAQPDPNPEAPGEGGGVGPGEQNPAPGPAENSGSGGQHGNPDAGCGDCDQQNQHQHGPQPEDSGSGSGQPGGSEEGVPNGGQSQKGTQYQSPANNASSEPPASDDGQASGSSHGKTK